MNYGVPNQSKASPLRINQTQQSAEARRSPQNYASQIVNPSFGATNPAKLVNGHSSYSQHQQLGHSSIPGPARVHNIPIEVSSRFAPQEYYRSGGTPPSTNPYMPTANRSPSSAMSYYPANSEQPVRDFQSRIPMTRQYFGNMSLTSRNRIEESVNHFRRGSAPGSAEQNNDQSGEEHLPMSYNLRQTTPDRKQPQLVASYYHPPTFPSSSYSRLEANQPSSSSRQIIQQDSEEDVGEIREIETYSTHHHPETMHTDGEQVIAETDILYSSSDEEDDVVRGCDQEGDLHLHLAAKSGCIGLLSATAQLPLARNPSF